MDLAGKWSNTSPVAVTVVKDITDCGISPHPRAVRESLTVLVDKASSLQHPRPPLPCPSTCNQKRRGETARRCSPQATRKDGKDPGVFAPQWTPLWNRLVCEILYSLSEGPQGCLSPISFCHEHTLHWFSSLLSHLFPSSPCVLVSSLKLTSYTQILVSGTHLSLGWHENVCAPDPTLTPGRG